MIASDELTCQEFCELVTEYLEGTLPSVDRARFDAHMIDCPYCPLYLEQMRQTIRALGTLPEDQLTPTARAELLQRFRDWKRG